MPSRALLDEFIAVVESGDHAGAIERYYTEDASMQENAAPPRVGRDGLVAHERGILARTSNVYSKAMSSVVEGDRVAIHWIFELTSLSGKSAPRRRDRHAGVARRQDLPRTVLLRSRPAEILTRTAISHISGGVEASSRCSVLERARIRK